MILNYAPNWELFRFLHNSPAVYQGGYSPCQEIVGLYSNCRNPMFSAFASPIQTDIICLIMFPAFS